MKIISGDPAEATDYIIRKTGEARDDIYAVSKSVSTFISKSKSDNKLKGKDFDKLRYHMQSYCDTLDNARRLMMDLDEKVKSSNNKMQDYTQQNNWKAPADEDNIPEAQQQYDTCKRIYEERVANRCTSEETVTDRYGNYLYTNHNGKYHDGEIADAYNAMILWENRLKYLKRMRPTDSVAYSSFNEKILEITTQTNSRCNEIQVMTIVDALRGLSGSSDVHQAFDELLKSGEYANVPSWVNDTSLETGAVSGLKFKTQWAEYENRWAEYKAQWADFKDETELIGIDDLKDIGLIGLLNANIEAVVDLGKAISGNYH